MGVQEIIQASKAWTATQETAQVFKDYAGIQQIRQASKRLDRHPQTRQASNDLSPSPGCEASPSLPVFLELGPACYMCALPVLASRTHSKAAKLVLPKASGSDISGSHAKLCWRKRRRLTTTLQIFTVTLQPNYSQIAVLRFELQLMTRYSDWMFFHTVNLQPLYSY